MYTQTRQEVAADRFRPAGVTAIFGSIAAWGGIKHGAPLPVLGGGLAVLVASVAYLWLNRSRPLPTVTNLRHVDRTLDAVDGTAENTRIKNSEAVQTALGAAEVTDVTIRPLPGNRMGDFAEVKLNGGRISNELADAVDKSFLTPMMRHPSSPEEYTLYLVE